MKNIQKKELFILLIFIILKLVIQLFGIHPIYELQRDEFLHIDLGYHLDFGYSSVPPITGLVSYIINILGNSIIIIKLIPAIFGALTILYVWKIVKVLNGSIFSLIIACTGVLFSIFIRINSLYQPNSFDFLIWTIVFYYLVKFLIEEQSKYLYYILIFIAIGFLNKYNIVFLAISLIPSILLTKYRKIFLNKHFYYATLCAFIIVLPNLIWQFLNDFPVIKHMKELSETQLVNIELANFLKAQAFFFMGSFIIIIMGLFSTLRNHLLRPIFFCYILTMLLFIILKAKDYYTIGLYPVLISIGSVYIDKLIHKKWYIYIKLLFVVLPFLFFFKFLNILTPFSSPTEMLKEKDMFDKIGATRWEDGKLHHLPQDYADMLGWKELTQLTDEAIKKLKDTSNTIIHCDNYGQAGAINFYTRHSIKAYSLNADYVKWYPFQEFEIKNVILVKSANDNDSNREKENNIFDKVEYIGMIKNPYSREYGTKVYLLENAKTSINKILKDEIVLKNR